MLEFDIADDHLWDCRTPSFLIVALRELVETTKACYHY
jgi:hypothetical protein